MTALAAPEDIAFLLRAYRAGVEVTTYFHPDVEHDGIRMPVPSVRVDQPT